MSAKIKEEIEKLKKRQSEENIQFDRQIAEQEAELEKQKEIEKAQRELEIDIESVFLVLRPKMSYESTSFDDILVVCEDREEVAKYLHDNCGTHNKGGCYKGCKACGYCLRYHKIIRVRKYNK